MRRSEVTVISNPEKPATKRRNLSDYLYLLSIPAIALLLMVVVTDVGGRMFFKKSIIAAHSLESLLLLSLIFFGVAVSWREGEFVRIELLSKRLPERIQLILALFAILLGLGCCGALIWLSINATIFEFSSGSRVAGSYIPLWPWRLIVPLGTSLLCYEMIACLIRIIRQLTRKGVVP